MTKQQLKNTIQVGIILILFILLFLSFLSFPTPKVVNLDTSWQQVLAYAFKHHWQAGTDYIFTYGPLGYFSLKNPSYNADLFYPTVVWWIFTSGFLSFIFLATASKLPHFRDQLVYLFLLAVIISEVSRFSDTLYFLAMIGATLLLLHPPQFLVSAKRYITWLGLTLSVFALLSLTKFIFLLLAFLCVTSLFIVFWQRYSPKMATATLGSFFLLFLGIWTLCQQSLWHLPTFLFNSFHLANHYSEAMSYPVDMTAVWLGLYTFGLTTCLILLNTLSSPQNLTHWVSGSLLLVGLFLNWKTSFVRYETIIHGVMFFSFAMIVPFLIERAQTIRWVRPALINGLIVTQIFVTLVGIFHIVGSHGYSPHNFRSIWANKIVENSTALWSLGKDQRYYDQLIAQTLKSQHELPNIQKQVGYATIDMFPPQQGVLFLNDLNYQPRPSFQGYSAYTKFLLEKNADFYANPQRAPKYVLLGIDVIDERFPTLEDSQTLNLILRDYQPLFMEKGWLLLTYRPRDVGRITQVNKPLLTTQVRMTDNIDLHHLSSKRLFINLDIQTSWLGKLSTFLFQLPPLMMEVETSDGKRFLHRIIPSMTTANFLLNPLLQDKIDVLQWYLGGPLKQVVALRIGIEPAWLQLLFQPTLTVTVSDSELTPYPLDAMTQLTLQQNLFSLAVDTIPDSVSVPNEVVILKQDTEQPKVDKEAAWVVHSPGEMRFKIVAGNYRLKGQFGILMDAYANRKLSPIEGVQFSAVYVAPDGQEGTIFQKVLRPLQVTEDQKKISFDFSFNLKSEGEIVLRTQAIPSNTPLGRGAFWSGVRISG